MSPTIQLMITCIIDSLYPEIGEAVVNVLRQAGVNIEFPAGQTCCGQPAYNAGMRQQARQMAIQTIRAFENTTGDIIIPSGSCCGMIRCNYSELFAEDETWLARAKTLGERCYEFSEYLVDVLGITDLGSRFTGNLTYHSSCHLLRELGVDRQPRALLNAIQGANLVELPNSQDCCGFGGVFSVEHAELSAAFLQRKITNIEITQAPVVVACDAGCITHINGGLHRLGKYPRAMHIAEILNQR
jgi:L-lactate dehydrogenase complex protein LldE